MGPDTETEWTVKFRFTTFDLRRSMATGRTGQTNMMFHVPKEEVDMEDVKNLCVGEVYRLKPKWNILSLDIESIEPPKKKRAKTKA
jgi:hypothetical protein